MTSEQYDILLTKCAPHPVFSSDWLTFTDAEFADVLLPDAGLVKGTNLYFFDGAELLPKGCRFPKRLMRLPDGKAPLLTMYSYPKDVKAAQRRGRVQPQVNELLLFAEIDRSGKVDVYLDAGESVEKTIEQLCELQDISLASIGWGRAMKTSESAFKEFFEKEFSHYRVLQYAGNMLGLNLNDGGSLSDTLLESVEWLREDGSIVETYIVSENIRYGEKVKLSLKFKNATTKKVKITIGPAKEDGSGFVAEEKCLVFNTTLESGEAATSLFTIPFEWYNECKEKYYYKKHYTDIFYSDMVKFEVKIKIGKLNFYLGQEKQLVPTTYHRNYEELIGLTPINDNSQANNSQNSQEETKDCCEDAYIKQNTTLEKNVDSFVSFIRSEKATSLDKIKERVKKDARMLWELAVQQCESPKYADDRPLYWARLKMQVALKRTPVFKDQIDMVKSIVIKGSELDGIINMFENLSRNYTGIDFSQTPDGCKKVLLMGFDPFQLDKTYYGDTGPETFNPSGLLALQLHGKVVENAFVQTCIFPVKYEDFDNGVVEEVMKRYANEADVIISTSLNGDEEVWEIEECAVSYRGGFHDNMNIGFKTIYTYKGVFEPNKERYRPNENKDFTYTSLLEEKIFGKPFELEFKIEYDESKSDKEGSGGNYLSNEIMYRITKYRDENGLGNKPVGHVHIGNYGDIKGRATALETMKEIIRRICE